MQSFWQTLGRQRTDFACRSMCTDRKAHASACLTCSVQNQHFRLLLGSCSLWLLRARPWLLRQTVSSCSRCQPLTAADRVPAAAVGVSCCRSRQQCTVPSTPTMKGRSGGGSSWCLVPCGRTGRGAAVQQHTSTSTGPCCEARLPASCWLTGSWVWEAEPRSALPRSSRCLCSRRQPVLRCSRQHMTSYMQSTPFLGGHAIMDRILCVCWGPCGICVMGRMVCVLGPLWGVCDGRQADWPCLQRIPM